MNFDSAWGIVIFIVGVCLFVLLFCAFANWYVDFARELKRLNTEINRCTGRERKSYIKQRRLLFLSILPFVNYERF